MAPVVHGLESEYADSIVFTYLDVDQSAVTPFRQELGMRSIPQFYLLDGDGAIIQQWSGPVPPDAFTEAFDAALATQ